MIDALTKLGIPNAVSISLSLFIVSVAVKLIFWMRDNFDKRIKDIDAKVDVKLSLIVDASEQIQKIRKDNAEIISEVRGYVQRSNEQLQYFRTENEKRMQELLNKQEDKIMIVVNGATQRIDNMLDRNFDEHEIMECRIDQLEKVLKTKGII